MLWILIRIASACGYSLESPRRGDSNEYPQHMFLWRNKAKQKYMCVSGFILRKNRVGRSDLIFIYFFNFIRNTLPYV